MLPAACLSKVIDDIIARVIQLKDSAVIPIMAEQLHDNDDNDMMAVLNEWNAGVKIPVLSRKDIRFFYDYDERYQWVDFPWQVLVSNMIKALLRELRQLVTQLRVSSPALF